MLNVVFCPGLSNAVFRILSFLHEEIPLKRERVARLIKSLLAFFLRCSVYIRCRDCPGKSGITFRISEYLNCAIVVIF